MNTIIVEFTGTPEAGKTTCIKNMINHFNQKGYSVDYIQESAEIVSQNIPKGSFNSHLWMRLHSLEMILSQRHNQSDILLVDRGIIDGIFYTYLFLARNPKEEKNCSALIQFLNQLDFLLPNFLFVFTANPDVSINRRGGEGRLVTHDYIKTYNRMLTSFIPNIPVPYKVIDSSYLSKDEVSTIVTQEITNLLSKKQP